MTVISLQDKKYEIERDENGLMVGMWRNGDFWKSGLELFAHAQVFHAALDEIERLSVVASDIDVRRILLAVVPGDGNGEEVYAKSVSDVEAKLTEMGQRIEEFEGGSKDSGLAALRDMLRAEVDRLISGSDVQTVYEKCAKIAEAHGDWMTENPACAIADCIREHAQRHAVEYEGVKPSPADLEHTRNAGFVEASRIHGPQIEAGKTALNMIENIVHAYDDSRRPADERAYVSGTLEMLINEARALIPAKPDNHGR